MQVPNCFPILLSLFVLLSLASCQQEHLEVYEKPITAMFLVLTPVDSGSPVVLSYLDNDGLGGRDPVITNATLKPNTQYAGELRIQVQNPNPSYRMKHIIDTTTVTGLPESHQVFYTPLDELELNSVYSDKDSNGKPVGFKTILNTGNSSQGRLRLSIIHNPNKLGPNVALGQIDAAGGKIDLEATFEIIISATN